MWPLQTELREVTQNTHYIRSDPQAVHWDGEQWKITFSEMRPNVSLSLKGEIMNRFKEICKCVIKRPVNIS